MKRTLRSISQNQQRFNTEASNDMDELENASKRDHQFMPQRLHTVSNDRRIQFQSHQHHPMRNSSQGDFLIEDQTSTNNNQKDQHKIHKLLKFEKGKLVKQVDGNQSIKGFDLHTIKEYTDQVKQQRQLPAVYRSIDNQNNKQQASLDKFIDHKEYSSAKKNQQEPQQKYANIDHLLKSLNKTQKERELETNAQQAQNQRIKLVKINKKGQNEVINRSFTQSDQKTNNRLDDSIQYSPSRPVKTEQYENDNDYDAYQNYLNQQRYDDKISPLKKQATVGAIPVLDQAKCPAKKESNKLENRLNQFMNQYDEYYKHIKGECLCTRCICGGCKCDAKEPKIEKPMKQNKTNYEINYQKKPVNTDKLRFDMSNYNSELIPKDSKFQGNTTQKIDYQTPSQMEQLKKIVPKDNIIQGPAVQWGTSYNRNYINFGNVPTFQQPRGQDRTTSDKMKFIDGTTYDRFHNKKDNSPQQKFEAFVPQGSLEYALKNPKPFIGDTTNNHFYKPYNVKGIEKKWEQKDHLLTGAPTHNGFYDTNHNKEYGEKNRICPAKIEKQEILLTKRNNQRDEFLNTQKELMIDHSTYGRMTVDYK